MSLQELMRDYRERVETVLEHNLPAASIYPPSLHQAMRYAALDGGKRVRAMLVYASGQALGVSLEQLDDPASAVEMIHAYSLVHDDLPAMDDDDLRRGKPTCHKAYDEATAILVGDALQTQAFYVLAHSPRIQAPAEQRLRMIECLALASGSRGMCGGQAVDIAAEGQALSLPELEEMHIHKTGMLIRASVTLGALCSEQFDEDVLKRLDHYAKCIGLSFQIQDDILDIEGETEELGKQQGADAARQKPTYPALLGLDGARQRARELHEDALASLTGLDEAADPLRWLSEYIINRRT
ncbi:MAG: (2E,6E)-farnesyl diphosphate synthase [Gammaproteobacteria bacterium]|nr:(2E,6E)-farnesyl diphosphate synthase [Gammaproteobacteria bacterium]